MAEFKPNEDQKLFLKSKNANVLVSASAGSGKTSTMIQKLSSIIADNDVSITSLMVVTYTNAAAAEIKQKLYDSLTKLIHSSVEEKKNKLKKQLDNLNNAEIGTLHAICKKLITKYFYKLNITPDFSLISEKESKYLIDTAIKNVFNTYIINEDDGFYGLYECYNTKRNDLQLKKIVIAFMDYINSRVDYNSWNDKVIEDNYTTDLNNNLACNYVMNYFKSKFNNYLKTLLNLEARSRDFKLDKFIDFILEKKHFIDEFDKAKDYETSFKIIHKTIFMSKPSKPKNANVDVIELDEELKVFNDSFKKDFEDIKKMYISSDIDILKTGIESAKVNLFKLKEIVDNVKKEYSLLKSKRNSLDFNDLEEYMLNLLENEDIRDLLRQEYKFVFVDEYQDINDKQELIINKLVSKNNYYMIGDVKQCIYAFRQSSPKIFISKYQKFKDDNVDNVLIKFNTNYRSDANILEFANIVFQKLITTNTIGIDYLNDAMFVTEKNYKKCNVKLNIIDESKTEDDSHVNKTDKSDSAKLESMIIAEEIISLKQRQKEDGTYYDYKDIAIITRKGGDYVRELYEYLSQLNIPVNVNIKTKFFETSEVQLLISILQVVSNYKNDIAFATVLKNLFDVSDEELYFLRVNSKLDNFYDAAKEYTGADSLYEKISKLFAFIKESQRVLTSLTISEWLYDVVVDFEILNKYKCFPDGIERERNIFEFLSFTENDVYKYNIDKLLEYIQFVSKEESNQMLGGGGNSVQICTIHHSKGLEYPAVIFAGIGRQFNINFETHNIIINERFGVGLKSIDSNNRVSKETIIRYASKLDNQKSEMDEEIRLLYVAMTRAREYLSLVGSYDISKIGLSHVSDIYSSKSYLDMIFKAVSDKYLSHFTSKDNFVITNENRDLLEVNIIKDAELEDNSQTKELILSNIDENLINELENIQNKNVDKKVFTIKNTVTNILKEETDYEMINYMPKKLDLSDELLDVDYLKLGTAYHNVMMHLNFDESKEDIVNLIDRLVNENEVDLEVKKDINVLEIYNACQTMRKITINSDKIYKEKQFLMQENYNKLVENTDNNTKVIIQGVIDFVVVKENKAILVDYKTNRTNNSEKLKEQYRLQLKLYKKAFEKATNIKVDKTYLYSFYQNKLIEIL